MGRGVRGAEDHCAVLLLGPKLTQLIADPANLTRFGAWPGQSRATGRAPLRRAPAPPPALRKKKPPEPVVVTTVDGP